MREEFKILIADRNRNILDFLKRELAAEGYLVKLTNNGPEVLKMMNVESPDLLILDLDMPYLDGLEILEQLQNNKYSIPVIVHSLLIGQENHPAAQRIAAFVEKDGNNVNFLKALINEILREYYPHRFDDALEKEGR